MMKWISENWQLIVWIITVTAMFVAWALSKTFTKKSEVEELSKRISKVETTLELLPDKDELHVLDKNLVEVGGKLDAIMPQLESLKKTTQLLMENELRGSSKQ